MLQDVGKVSCRGGARPVQVGKRLEHLHGLRSSFAVPIVQEVFLRLRFGFARNPELGQEQAMGHRACGVLCDAPLEHPHAIFVEPKRQRAQFGVYSLQGVCKPQQDLGACQELSVV